MLVWLCLRIWCRSLVICISGWVLCLVLKIRCFGVECYCLCCMFGFIVAVCLRFGLGNSVGSVGVVVPW